MLYFNLDEIPEEKALLKPLRRAVLAMLAHIQIKRRMTPFKRHLKIPRSRSLRKLSDRNRLVPQILKNLPIPGDWRRNVGRNTRCEA